MFVHHNFTDLTGINRRILSDDFVKKEHLWLVTVKNVTFMQNKNNISTYYKLYNETEFQLAID